jgi:hypothetical protein
MDDISWLFGLSCVLNALWIVSWHYEKLPYSLVVMLGLLATLICINIFVRDTNSWIIKASFGIYLGWICIAAIANVTALLVNYGWNGFGISEEVWTVIMIFAGTIIGALSVHILKNPFIGLSVAWALIGIAVKRQDDYRSIFISAIIALILIAAVTSFAFFRKGIK